MDQQIPKIIANIPKLPLKYAGILIPFFLSCLMSAIISMINMIKNLGFVDGFFGLWASAWLVSWMFAFPIVLVLLPMVRRLVGLLVDMRPPQ
jgi:hypothetical protein